MIRGMIELEQINMKIKKFFEYNFTLICKRKLRIGLWVLFISLCGWVIASKSSYWYPSHLYIGIFGGALIGFLIGWLISVRVEKKESKGK